MVDSAVLIGAVIIAVVQFIKFFSPTVTGPVTIVVSAVIGVLIALLDTHIGVGDITVAQGLMTGLAASGVITAAAKVNSQTVVR